MSAIDLHIHSTASDGRFSPADIVRKSAAKGLNVIAITDHDTVDGITPALETAGVFPRLRVIPGVEISTDFPEGEVHVLGYFIDYTDRELRSTLERMRNSRWERARGMVAKLNNLGVQIQWQRVQEIAAGGALGRPHIAQAMLEKGYIGSIKEAFDKYIGHGGPAYVEREKITPVTAVELVLRTRGLPVLAHPLTIPDPETLVIELKAAGLVGIEAYYGNYTPEEIDNLVSLAYKYGMITTGGSDYHGLDDSAETMLGGVDVPTESVEQLMAMAEQRGLTLPSPSA
jgi:predicted metal-dependent phosphoesterase TrpH